MAYYRKRGNKWSFTVDIGKDPISKERRQKTVSGFATKKEAEIACALLLSDVEKGNYVHNKETLRGFTESFLEDNVKHNVSLSTYVMQRGFAERHIYPFFGDIKLTDITPIHIKKFYAHMIEKGYSGGSIQNYGVFLGKVLRAAQEWGFVNRNVVSVVQKPTSRPEQMKVWTQDEVNLFLRETRGTRFHVVYMLALSTGMRIGEIQALQWNHIDFVNHTISVTQTVVHADRQQYIKETKTAKSRRLITIPPSLVKYLKEYKLQYPTNSLNLIVPGIKSEITYNNVIVHEFHKEVERLGLPNIRFHDLRHTHATLLLSMGENPKVVQERLGHAKISTTLDTYSHVLPTMQKEAADKLEGRFDWG